MVTFIEEILNGKHRFCIVFLASIILRNLRNEGSVPYYSKENNISFEKEKYIVPGVQNLTEHKLVVRTGKIVKYNIRLFIFQNSPTLIRLSHRTIGSGVGKCYFFRSTYLAVAKFYIQKTSLSDFSSS